ncbi:MAG: hypothetical protein ACREOO_29365 [bacterium]
MRRTTLLFSLGIGLLLQEGRAQSTHTSVHKDGKADTARVVPPNVSVRKDSLHFEGGKLFDSWAGSGEAGWGVWFGPQSKQAFYLFTDSSKACVTIHPCGKVHFANSLAVNGTTTTKILTVTGGADIAEPFPVSEHEAIVPGAVVVIDQYNPGQLRLCRKAYDTRVAGVVSGAGGLNPGLTLQAEGRFTGELKLALSGRVYALATAAPGRIEPGDLLTTSEVAGHAMKATDKDSACGAILGKALTGLDAGEGLVLVLVNLQ